MKYEPVFGDQSLFDGAPSDSTHTTKRGGFYRVTEDGGVQYLSRGPLNGNMCKCIGGDLIAERRIIAEPNRWTVEDQKAGRLPEVGAYVFFGKKGENVTRIAEFIGVGTIDSVWCLKLRCGSYVFVQSEIVSPIETPEEKAQRLRSEWISKAYVDFHRFGCEIEVLQKEQLKQVYDALLSGELTMPSKGGEL